MYFPVLGIAQWKRSWVGPQLKFSIEVPDPARLGGAPLESV